MKMKNILKNKTKIKFIIVFLVLIQLLQLCACYNFVNAQINFEDEIMLLRRS